MRLVVQKSDEYVFNHCTRYLSRDKFDNRHDYLGTMNGGWGASFSDAWRFPIVDAHDPVDRDEFDTLAYADWNDVTFVFLEPRSGPAAQAVHLLASFTSVLSPHPMHRVGDSIFWSTSFAVPKGQRHIYRFVVDGRVINDPINPLTRRLATGETWSSFITWECAELLVLERWEFAILDRLVRHILPFNDVEARNFLARGASDADIANLYRLDVPVGVANFIDKLLAREERHQLPAYRTCLGMLADVLRRRNPGADPELLEERHFVRLYDEMADPNRVRTLMADGWDERRYGNPSYFLYLVRRHAWTGAFSHPRYGGNPGGMAWAYLAERFHTFDGAATAFDWRRSIEPPLGTSKEYLG